jgi:hypothetical protein
MIAGNHDHGNTRIATPADCLFHAFAGGILESNYAVKYQIRVKLGVDRIDRFVGNCDCAQPSPT